MADVVWMIGSPDARLSKHFCTVTSVLSEEYIGNHSILELLALTELIKTWLPVIGFGAHQIKL